MAQTLSEKIWDRHVVVPGADGKHPDLLYIDLHLVHEVTSPQAFEGLRLAGRSVRRPDLTVATADHNVPTLDIDKPIADPISRRQLEVLTKNCADFGVIEYGIGDPNQGVVHVIGPEQGLTQPGMTIVCGDSHTSTHGAFGALAFGIGTSEVEHVLATQTLPQERPKKMAIEVNGTLPAGVTAKDVVLAIIGRIGTGGGIGHVIEYRGDAIRALSMEGRMTVCNMSIEAGARAGMIAPDDITFAYLEGRRHVPQGKAFEVALDDWRSLVTDDGASFDTVVEARRGGDPSARHLGDQSRPGDDDRRRRPRSSLDRRRRRGERRCPGARVHGPFSGDGDLRHPHRHCVYWLLHEQPDRRPDVGGASRRRAQGLIRGPGACGPRLPAGEARGRGAWSRRRLPRRRLRMAGGGLLDVLGHEPRPAVAG